MNIAIFGAAGMVGSRVVAEAVSRGHGVTAVTRHPERASAPLHGVSLGRADAASAVEVAEVAVAQDVVIGATRPAPGREKELVAAAQGLLAGAADSGARLLLVGGAGSLTLPGSGVLVAEDPRFVPAAWRAIALACCEQLELCRAESRADWTAVSPPALLERGERTGRYRTGGDELLIAADGRSWISVEDFAVALLDEAERPRHRRSRFTVAY